MANADDITEILGKSSLLIQDPSKPSRTIVDVEYNKLDAHPYHILRQDERGRTSLGSYVTLAEAHRALQNELSRYAPGSIRLYTPEEHASVPASASDRANFSKPQGPLPASPHNAGRAERHTPPTERDKNNSKSSHSPAMRPEDKPEYRAQHKGPDHAGSSITFGEDEGGKIRGKPMDIAEGLKARREAAKLGWSDSARDYDAEYKRVWGRFQHEGQMRTLKEMGELTGISAAGAVGGLAAGAGAGVIAAEIGLSGVGEGVLVGSISGAGSSAAEGGALKGFGYEMSAKQYATKVAAGALFGGILGAVGGFIGSKISSKTPPGGPPPTPPEIPLTKWTVPKAQYGPYHHWASPETLAKIAETRTLMGATPRSVMGMMGKPSVNASKGPLPPGDIGVEFMSDTKPLDAAYLQTGPNGARWTTGMEGVSSDYIDHPTLGPDTEHAVINIIITKIVTKKP